jgi:hypothetical protein
MTSSEYDSTVARRFGMTLGQRLAAVFLASVTVVSFLGVVAQRDQASYWQRRAIAAEATLARVPAPVNPITSRPSLTNGYYDALLVGMDGKTHPISGKAIQIFTGAGEEKMLEIELDRQEQGRLLMWSPSYKDEEYFHRIIVRPACANVLELELEKVDLSDGADMGPGTTPLFQRLPPR